MPIALYFIKKLMLILQKSLDFLVDMEVSCPSCKQFELISNSSSKGIRYENEMKSKHAK